MLRVIMGLERAAGRFVLTATCNRYTLEPDDLLRWALRLEGDPKAAAEVARELKAAHASRAVHMTRLDVGEETLAEDAGDLSGKLRKRLLRIVPEVVVRSMWGDVQALTEAVREGMRG